jgi:hypothetical protein
MFASAVILVVLHISGMNVLLPCFAGAPSQYWGSRNTTIQWTCPVDPKCAWTVFPRSIVYPHCLEFGGEFSFPSQLYTQLSDRDFGLASSRLVSARLGSARLGSTSRCSLRLHAVHFGFALFTSSRLVSLVSSRLSRLDWEVEIPRPDPTTQLTENRWRIVLCVVVVAVVRVSSPPVCCGLCCGVSSSEF